VLQGLFDAEVLAPEDVAVLGVAVEDEKMHGELFVLVGAVALSRSRDEKECDMAC
jgi:hypothetical protein